MSFAQAVKYKSDVDSGGREEKSEIEPVIRKTSRRRNRITLFGALSEGAKRGERGFFILGTAGPLEREVHV